MIIPHKSLRRTTNSVYCIHQYLRNGKIFFCMQSKDNNNTKSVAGDFKLPEEPQNCCMSGCANCVWVAYAEQVAKILNDGGETARQKILQNVKDPNLRAFLLLELSSLFNKKNG